MASSRLARGSRVAPAHGSRLLPPSPLIIPPFPPGITVESVNFATRAWLPIGADAGYCECRPDRWVRRPPGRPSPPAPALQSAALSPTTTTGYASLLPFPTLPSSLRPRRSTSSACASTCASSWTRCLRVFARRCAGPMHAAAATPLLTAALVPAAPAVCRRCLAQPWVKARPHPF